MNKTMYTLNIFEQAMNSCGYILDKVIFAEGTNKVHKVEGRVNIPKKVTVSRERKTILEEKKFRWDDAGRCYSFRSNIRQRNFDLPITTILEHRKLL